MKRTIQQFKNYRLIVQEFKLGLWSFTGNHYSWRDGHFTVEGAQRITDGLTLNIEDGTVQVVGRPWELGLFGSFVYLSIKKSIRRCEKELRKEPRDLSMTIKMKAKKEDIVQLRQLLKSHKSSLILPQSKPSLTRLHNYSEQIQVEVRDD